MLKALKPLMTGGVVSGRRIVRRAGTTEKPILRLEGSSSRDDALEIGRLGHRVFKKLRDSSIPTFAFVNGAAMGGGLEVALHCHYRTLAKKAAAIEPPAGPDSTRRIG